MVSLKRITNHTNKMSEVIVNGRIKIKTFQSSFLQKFPYLVPTLRTADGKGIDNELTIAGARSLVKDTYSPSGEAELSINGNLTVGGFENRFKQSFGVDCEICFKKGGRLTRTGADQDKMTLSALNKSLMDSGAEKITL
jgi:hypothetical protein